MLESFCLGWISERNIGSQFPCPEFRSMGGFSCVGLAEAFSQIIGYSHIAPMSWGQALNKKNVVQVEALLRSSFGGRPASHKRVPDPAKRRREAGRMGGDSNPRCLSAHTLSRRAQSTTLSPIQWERHCNRKSAVGETDSFPYVHFCSRRRVGDASRA